MELVFKHNIVSVIIWYSIFVQKYQL